MGSKVQMTFGQHRLPSRIFYVSNFQRGGVKVGLSAVPDSGKTVGAGSVAPATLGLCVAPTPIEKLDSREKKIWRDVVEAMRANGRVTEADSILVHVVVRSYTTWLDMEAAFAAHLKEEKTPMVVTPNGYKQVSQLFYAARDAKKALLEWLPEALLTPRAYQKSLGEGEGGQGNLFPDDPIEAHRRNRPTFPIAAVASPH